MLKTFLKQELGDKDKDYNYITKLMLKIVLTFAFIFLFVLLVMNISYSITFDEVGKVIFIPQKAGFVVLRAVAILLVLMLLKRIMLTISKKMFYIISLIYVLLNVCLVYILSLQPAGDQYYMTQIASDMIWGGVLRV